MLTFLTATVQFKGKGDHNHTKKRDKPNQKRLKKNVLRSAYKNLKSDCKYFKYFLPQRRAISQFLCELKCKFRFSKSLRQIFHFRLRFVFIKVLYFCSTKSMDSLTLKRHNSFQNKNNGKALHSFASRLSWSFMISA